MVFEGNFLRLTVTVCFQKMSTLKRWILLINFLVSNNKVVVTKKKNYFSPTFFKLWVNISENIAGVVEGSLVQYLFTRCVNIKKIAGFRKK